MNSLPAKLCSASFSPARCQTTAAAERAGALVVALAAVLLLPARAWAAPQTPSTPAATVQSKAPPPAASMQDPAAPVPANNAHEAALAAHDAAEAARAAAEAAKATAQAVHELAGHVNAIEHPEPGKKAEVAEWSYHFGISTLAKTGNASNFSGQSSLGVNGNFTDWTLEFKARGAYGSTQPLAALTGTASNNAVTAANAAASARGQYNYTPFLGNYLMASVFTDRMASIKYQVYGEPGVDLTWWEVERDGYIKSRLRTGLGFRIMRESRKTFYSTPVFAEGIFLYGPSASINYRYALSRGVYFTEDADVTYNIPNSRDVRVNSATALSVSISEHVALQVGANIRHIGHPAEERKPTDFEMNIGLTFDF